MIAHARHLFVHKVTDQVIRQHAGLLKPGSYEPIRRAIVIGNLQWRFHHTELLNACKYWGCVIASCEGVNECGRWLSAASPIA